MNRSSAKADKGVRFLRQSGIALYKESRMTSQDKLSFDVVGGPSKFDLMLSLFDGNKDPRRAVEFQLEGARGPITAAITMVQQEDGSGESWNFRGWLANYRRNFGIQGYYSSKSRKGHLTFEVPFHYVMRGSGKDKVVSSSDQIAVDEYIEYLRGKGAGWPIPHTSEYNGSD